MPPANNKRIAKNTVYLYIRMLITMLVTLYTSRVVLNVLGVEDFGVYNIIGGVVILFSFLNNAMSNATQRFLSYDLGKEDTFQLKKTFSMSITAHISISLLVFVLSETVGLWFINTHLNIPANRMNAANWVFQFTIMTFIINIIRVPYNASIIAYEKMSFFAYISIIEVLLKLLVVYLLLITDMDKLIFYSFLMFLVSFLVSIIYKEYCNKKFTICRYHFSWNKNLYVKLMSFSGWSMLGGIANIGAQQGANILLNIFSGVTSNAAFGIANQVSNAVYSFVSNFQLAFNPQIIKLYSVGDNNNLHKLMFRTSLFSYYLLLIIAVPFLINTETVLQLWLKNVPDYSVVFCQLMIIYYLIDSIQAPLWNAIYATGQIRTYQLWLSGLLILNIPLSYYLLRIGMSPSIVLAVRVGLNFISAIIRTIYIKYCINFPSMKYLIDVVLKAVIVTIVAFTLSIVIKNNISATIAGFLWATVLSVIVTGLIMYLIGINKNERASINTYVRKIFNHNKS
jgi:O-antigen/teichoic acid export membrane protein